MRIITIGFSRAKSSFAIYGKLIQAIESRPYSHAYVKYTDPESGIEMVFQAAHGMVNIFNYEIFQQKNTIIEEYEFECNDEQWKDLWIFINKTVGTGYGWLQSLGILFKKIAHIKNPFKDDIATEVCSELAARVAIMLNVKIDEDLDEITPSDLNKILEDYYDGEA